MKGNDIINFIRENDLEDYDIIFQDPEGYHCRMYFEDGDFDKSYSSKGATIYLKDKEND